LQAVLMLHLTLGAPLTGRAATYTWDTVTGDSSITDGAGIWQVGVANWFDGALYDQVWADGNDAVFGGGTAGTAGTVTLGSAITVGNITLSPPFAGLYTIDTGTFGLTINSGITANESATILSGVGGSVILGANNSWSVASGKTLTVSSVIADGGNYYSLTKSGSGTLVLAGANNYSGGTIINAGTLQAGSASAIQGNLAINAGTLDLNGNNATIGTLALGGAAGTTATITTGTGTLTLGGNVTFDATSNPNGATISGLLALGGATRTFTVGDSTATTGSTADLTVLAPISGSGVGLTKEGAGVLALAGANTFTGPVTLNAGVLAASQSADALGTGAATLTLNGGTLALVNDTPIAFGRNTTVAGNVTILSDRATAGTAVTHSLGTLSIGANTLTISQIGTAGGTGTSADMGLTFGTVTMTGNAVFNVVNVGSGNTATLGGVNESGGSYGLTKSGSGILIINAAGNYSGKTTISGGTLSINSIGNVGGGNSALGNPATVANGTISIGSGATSGTLTFTGGAGATTDRVIDLAGTTGDATINANQTAGILKFTSDITATGAGDKTLTLGGTSTSDNEFAGIILDNSSGNITQVLKAGAGKWILSGANTYRDNTTIDQGTLQIISIGNVNGGATSVGNPNSVSNGRIRFGGDGNTGTLIYTGGGNSTDRTIQIGDTGTTASSTDTGGATILNNGTGPLTFTATAFNAAESGVIASSARVLTLGGTYTGGANTIQGVIINNTVGGSGTGAVALNKQDASIWTLAGANTFSGGVTISAGTLNINNAGSGTSSAIGTGTLTITGGTIDNTTGSAITLSTANPVAFNGDFTFGGTKSLNLGGGAVAMGASRTITLNGTGTTLTFGTLSHTAATAALTVNDSGTGNKLVLGGVNLAFDGTSRTRTYSGSGAIDITGEVANGGTATASALTYSGTSTLTLSGNNTYGGTTTINEGVVVANHANALGTIVGNTVVAGSGANSQLQLVGLSYAAEPITLSGRTLSSQSAHILNTSGNSSGLGTISLNTGGQNYIISSSSGTLTLSGNIVAGNATSGRNVYLQGAGDGEISGQIDPANSIDISVFKRGSGTWTLSGANGYDGTTTISDGTLKLGANEVIPNASVVTINKGILDINGKTETLGGATALTLGAATTTVAGDTATVSDTASGGSLILSGNVTYNSGSAGFHNGTATIGANLDLNGGDRTFTINDSDQTLTDTVVSGQISNGGVVKAGTGRLVLSGNNSFAGAVTLNASGGTLRVDHANALGTTAAGTTVGSGAALELNGVSIGAEALSLAGTGISAGGALRNLAGNNIYGGAITLTAATRINSDSGTLNLSSGTAITSSFGLAFGGAGNITLSDAFAPSATPGQIVTKDGTGTLTLANAGNAYTGGTTINLGEVRSGAASVLPDTGTITVSASSAGIARLNLNGFSDTIAALTLGGASGVAGSVNEVTTGVGTLTLGGNLTVTATGDWTTSALISGKLDLGGANRTFSIANSTGVDVDLDVQAVVSGASFGPVKTGAGTLLLSAANTYTGATFHRAGTIRIGINNALPSGNGFTFQNRTGGSVATLDLAGRTVTVGTLTLSENATAANQSGAGAQTEIVDSATGGLLKLAGNATYNAGPAGEQHGQTTISANLDLNGATRTFTINDSDQTTQEVTVSGAIQNSTGIASLTKAGAGTLILSGANTHSGLTTVSGGVLTLNGTAFANTVIPGNGVTTDFDVLINGGKLRISASEQLGNTTGIDLTLGELEFGSPSGLTETIGMFRNTGGTFTSGANTLVGTGNSITWSGGVNTINAGGLVQDSHWVITGGANTVEGGATRGTLHVQSGGDGLELGGTSSPTVTLNSDDNEAGRLLLGGNVTVLGTLTSGTAQILSGGAAANPGFIDLDGGTRTFTVNNGSAATDLLISARIQNGGLIKAGAGTMKLTGDNTFTGPATVNAGTLELGAANAPASASGVTVNTGGTLLLSGSGNRIGDAVPMTLAGGTFNTGGLSETLGVLTLSASSVIDFGAGTSVLNFANSSGASWTGTLSVWNWTGYAANADPNDPIGSGNTDGLFFGADATGLTSAQLSQIQFFSDSGTTALGAGYILGTGQVVPVPEPATWLALAALLGAVGFLERHRLVELLRSFRHIRRSR
jgi:autotransporter-associated beta strand protein